ncbi:MAG: alpha/beta hydrolase [Anaerolineae bacterium]|jgi:alpha-beta hydrolase superfamily lysophospholipase|nr:alpha/beta hydrolase [Anaerolineae bacterium]MBT3714671.1 alpha/beta hydrolase [Anaerolineae bacterium]MBT4310044.1 alpha/beta hydrolase [Anaerolineae bacterium]MBT4457454.1 alpha/beta hydrolase [Anaerolineae bacterium]MBT4843030.1 alpha/beta hydrolase [Anaerolineae bacterium]
MSEEKRSKIKWRFKSKDGLKLFTHAFPSENPPKAIVCMVHGHGEHIERYEHLAAALNDANYAMIGFDHRGHGQSEGTRGHTPSYETLLDDIDAFLAEVDEYYPDLPRILYGHSMGGNIVLNYVLRRKPDLKGVITTGSWIKLAFEPPAVQVFLGKMMNMIYPAFIQNSGLETAAISRDPEVVRAYEEDPFVHNKISARLFVGMYEAGLWSLEHAAEFPLPLLLMHGSADRLTSADASGEFAEKAGDKVKLKIWDGFYHEIHNEPEQADVFKVIIDWLDSQ